MDQAIEQLKTTRPTFSRWLREGRIKGMKVGRQWRFRPEDVDRFLRGEQPRVDLPVNPGPLLDALAAAMKQAGLAQDEIHDGLKPNDPIRAACWGMLRLAQQSRASDLHLHAAAQPGETPGRSLVRLRVDGVMHPVLEFDMRLHPAVVAGFKRLAACYVETTTLPQDGRMIAEVDGVPVDVRFSFLPACSGEAMTARLLNRNAAALSLDQLPFEEREGRLLREAIDAPHGLIAVVGPMGSGKTTTLYCALQAINRPDVKIITLEDPIEYVFPGIVQIQAVPRDGLTLELTMRSALRAAPDVLMLGEMRTPELMHLCFQTAMTGHLVLTTLHTNTAAAALQRMLDLDADPFLIGETGRLIVAQRLVRKLCPHCSRETRPDATQLEHAMQLARDGGVDWNALSATFREAVGCAECSQLGYRGRTAMVEMMEITPKIAAALRRGASEAELTAIAVGEGMTTLTADGVRRAARGETTLDEVLRVAANL